MAHAMPIAPIVRNSKKAPRICKVLQIAAQACTYLQCIANSAAHKSQSRLSQNIEARLEAMRIMRPMAKLPAMDNHQPVSTGTP